MFRPLTEVERDQLDHMMIDIKLSDILHYIANQTFEACDSTGFEVFAQQAAAIRGAALFSEACENNPGDDL